MRRLIQRSRSIAWASLLALVVLLALAGPGAGAEEPPAITSPGEQTGVTGKAATVIVTGTNLASLTATGLPAGISPPVKVSTSEWKIEGTPTTAETATVTLEAKNAEGTPGPTVEFKWTVNTPEATPAITSPGEQTGVTGKAATVIVTGTNLASLTATGLPAGISPPVKVSASEWKIEGTPTTAETATVTLEAKNAEGTPGPTVEFKWTVKAPEATPAIEKPADQSSTAGSAITTLVVKGTNLAALVAKELPPGLELTKVSEEAWTVTGTPSAAKASTLVTLEATNKEGATSAVTFVWTVNARETPAKPVEPTPTPTPTPTVPSAGRLGTVPTQKQGRELFATFLCEVATCKVSVKATITVGKAKIKIHSSRITILQGKKARIPLRLNKSQRELIASALKKRKKVTAALSATIDSSVGLQVTKALMVTVKR